MTRRSSHPTVSRLRLALASVLTAGLVVGGCTSNELVGATDRDAHVERYAVVALSFVERDAQRAGEHLVAQAYLVEHAGEPRPELLRLLSLPVAAWLDSSLEEGACLVDHRSYAADARVLAAVNGGVRLLDAGEMALEGAGVSVHLESHYLPELDHGITGIAYGGLVDGGRALFGRAGLVEVVADGSDEVGELLVRVPTPAAVRLLTVGGEAADQPSVWLDRGADRAAGLPVTWTPPHGGAGDLTVISFTRRSFDSVAFVHCAVSDADGAFTIPREALLLLPTAEDDAIERVEIERVRAVSFTAPGMPDGLALAIARDGVHLD